MTSQNIILCQQAIKYIDKQGGVLFWILILSFVLMANKGGTK